MRRTASWMRRRVSMLAVAAVGVATIAGTALAGHITSGVKSYTGCLVSGDGVIIKVKEGNTPKSACTGGQTQVHLSGGDITEIAVTGALSGGGDNGKVTIGLKPEFTLPSGCATGRVAKWNGTAWTCGVDDDTTYTAGAGLDLSSSNRFSIKPEHQVKNTPDCSSGEFATGFDGDGNIQCAAPPTADTQVFANVQSTGLGIPSDGQLHDVVTLVVPPGAYSITAIGNAAQDADRDTNMFCRLFAGSSIISRTSLLFDGPTSATLGGRTMAMIGLRNFTASTTVKVSCQTTIDGVGAENWGLQAVKVG